MTKNLWTTISCPLVKVKDHGNGPCEHEYIGELWKLLVWWSMD